MNHSFNFTYPEFTMPVLKYGTSPALPQAGQAMYAWAEQFALTENPAVLHHMSVRTHPDVCAAFYYPTAKLELLAPLCNYALWAWVIDDALDDGISNHDVSGVADSVARMIRATEGAACPDSPSTLSGRNLFASLCRDRSAGWREALLGEVAAWLSTYVTEAAATRLDRVMDIEDYITHRRYGVDEISFLHLVEYAHGIDLPAEVRRLPAMDEARARASEWIGLYNDIFSAVKEEAVGYRHNAVLIIAHHQQCSPQQAVDTVNDILTRLIQQFNAAVARVPAQLSQISNNEQLHHDVALVLEGYRHVVRGNFDYHIERPRYVDATNYMAGEQHNGLRPSFSADEILRVVPS